MATERGTPARSRFLTAVLRKSCRMRPGHAGVDARLDPDLPEALELAPALGPMEHPRDDAAGFLLLLLGDGALGLERGAQLRRHHEHAPLEVLRRARIEPHNTGLEIDVSPLER